jgi:hypothetical protein
MRIRVLGLLALVIPPLASAADPDLLAAYAQFRSIALDSNRVAVAENLAIKRDAGTLQFTSGKLYALQPVLDKVAGVVFVGEGTFRFQPPSDIERQHLALLTNGPSLTEPFKDAVLLFTDSTFADLSAAASFKTGAIEPRAQGVLNDFRKAFRDDLKTNIEARTLAGLSSPRQSLFLAAISGEKHGKLLFSLDAMNGEAVSLIHYGSGGAETWSAFEPTGSPSSEERALIRTDRIDVDTRVDKGGRLDAEALDQFKAVQDGARMLLVQLAPELRVTRVASGDGAALPYIQEAKDKDADLWVILPSPLVKGAPYSWKFAYGGDGVVRKAGTGNYYVGDREGWYPKLDIPGLFFNDRAVYHMTFRAPKELTLVATGKPVKKSVDGKIAVTEWDTGTPYTVAGFNFGDYKTKTLKSNDIDIAVYANSDLGDQLQGLKATLEQNPELAVAAGITTGGLDTTGLMSQTLSETANALKLFSDYFGPLPFQNISVTQQSSGNFGQSWPTLIYMPYTSFLDGTMRHQLGMDVGRARQFYGEVGSHEIAHQWWGHLVGWRDYHDEWLSEGFAQFSAGLYMHRRRGEKDFLNFLAADKQFILSALPNSTERANDAGPISLGSRLSTEKTEGAYRLVYAKGDFVLHMLRMMLYDYPRGDDSRFIAMMKDYVQTNAGKGASTADFKATCDKHFGMDMGWFFNQWVFGTGIPKIGIQYSIVDGADGPVLVLDVKQEHVPDGFRSIVPIVLKGKTAVAGVRLSIAKSEMHYELKLREKPETIEFNALEGLLCELEVKKR